MGILVGPPVAAATATTLKRQTFTSSGSFVVPAGVTQLRVKMIGAGGSGSASSNTVNQAVQGGAAGELSVITLAVTPGHTLTIAIGAGGAPVATTVSTFHVAGNAGGDTTVTDSTSSTLLATAKGGSGGKDSSANPQPLPAPGGFRPTAASPPTTIVTFPAGPGWGSVLLGSSAVQAAGQEQAAGFGCGGGCGGSSGFAATLAGATHGGDGANNSGAAATGGSAAANSGSGGGGAYSGVSTAAAATSGAGGSGYCELEWVA